MNNFEVNDDGNHIVAFNKLLCKSFPHHLFDPAYLLANGLLNETVENHQGRGAVKYFKFNGISMVLRHYYRGGWPAKFVNDHYFWFGLKKTRAMQETKLLSELHGRSLPVPEPVAAHICKSGISYRADIVTVFIPEARTLGEILQIKSLDGQVWEKIGKTIRKFHDHNCNHSDLNANNLMINGQDQIYLIDFDRSRIEESKGNWQESNLRRLHRSLEKHEGNVDFNFSEQNFTSLMDGYCSK